MKVRILLRQLLTKSHFMGLSLLVVFHRLRWTRLNPSGVMVKTMVADEGAVIAATAAPRKVSLEDAGQ